MNRFTASAITSVLNTEMTDDEFEALLSDELVFDIQYTTSNGVMMGDPGTKGLLTLWNLVAEEEANEAEALNRVTLRDIISDTDKDALIAPKFQLASFGVDNDSYLTSGHDQMDKLAFTYKNKMITRIPRFFSCAGDDHCAIGKLSKLRDITSCHRANSMVPHSEKNFLSTIGAIYCERLIMRDDSNRASASLKGKYESHYIVDSLKTRLFSPCTKSRDLTNEPNPAIGKAYQLFRTANWLPEGWSNIRSELVPLRFQQRMYHFLPHLNNGQIDPIVKLPAIFGGLNICNEFTNFVDVLETLSENHLQLISTLIEDVVDERVITVLGSMFRDRFARGISFDETGIDMLFHEMNTLLEPKPKGLDQTVEHHALPEVHDQFGYANKRRKLESFGFVTNRNVRKLYSRSNLQKKLLVENVSLGWEQSPWPTRRAKFEQNMAKLVSILKDEGKLPQTYVSKLDTICEYLDTTPLSEVGKIAFEEDLFYHEKMQVQGTDIYPIKELVSSVTRLELPPVIERGWFPPSNT